MTDITTGFCFSCSVGRSEGRGFGVFAREPIEKGRVVWRHVPEVFVVYDERTFRANIETLVPADVVYELTHVHAFEDFPGCLIRALDHGILINHSNSPNLATNNSRPASISLDSSSSRYLDKVTEALLDDRYSLVAVRDIEVGDEFTNDYTADDDCPPYYDVLCEQFGVREDFLSDG